MIFGGGLLNKKACFDFSVRLLSEKFLILGITERDVIKMYIGLHVKYPLFLWDINETWFFDTFSKNSQISNWLGSSTFL